MSFVQINNDRQQSPESTKNRIVPPSERLLESANDKTPRGRLLARRGWRSSFHGEPPVARIYCPARSVMQSGGANSRRWVLEFEPTGKRWIEPLMGWSATDDPYSQIRLTFPTKETAIRYVEAQGLRYEVRQPPRLRVVPKSYKETILGRSVS